MEKTAIDLEVERQLRKLKRQNVSLAKQRIRLAKEKLKKKNKFSKSYSSIEKALSAKKAKVRVIRIRQLQDKIKQKKSSLLSQDKYQPSTFMR